MSKATKDTKKDKIKEEINEKKSKVSAKKVVKTKTSTAKKKTTIPKKDTTKAKKSDEKNKAKVSTSKSKKTTTKKEPIAKKVVKKVTAKKETKATTSKTKKSSSTVKKSKTSTTKTKKVTEKKSNTTSKKTTTKKKNSQKVKKVDTNIVAEYYDLPYRYNETIVKILYQTPNVLFVYWDISDDDKNKFINEYGENFFYDTKPILKIFNLTKNYNFEIEINDFANSWYINVNDSKCDYKVELARRPISYNTNINSDYIYVSSSNDIAFPNDHILLEELPDIINFKNVKTNKITTRKISTLRLIGIDKIYSIYDFYKMLYKDDVLDELNNKKIINPSSTSSWSN